MKEKFQKFFDAQQEKGAFKGLTFEELGDEQLQELHAAYLGHLEDELKAAQEEAKGAKQGSSEANARIEELNASIVKSNAKFSEINLKLSQKLTQNLLDNSASNHTPKQKKSIEVVKGFMKELKSIVKNKSGEEIELKLEDMNNVIATKADTLTTSVANSTRGVMDPNITRLAHRRLTAYESIPSKPLIPVNGGGKYRWVDQDEATSVRAAAIVAEGTAFPESTIAWIEREIGLIKIGDHIPYSDEFEYDYANFMQEIADFLRTNVNIKVDDELIDRILAVIPAYVPVASGIVDANIFDLMCKVSEDITDDEGSKYMPNVVYMNSSDIVSINYLLKKDANNNYMGLQMMAEQKGFTIIENNRVPANQMILGDNRYIHVPEDGVITIKRDVYAGDDQIEGITRMLVQTRKNLLIKNLELTGWRQVTDIAAALTTLAS